MSPTHEQGREALSHPLLLSQAGTQGPGSELEQPGHEWAPMWDVPSPAPWVLNVKYVVWCLCLKHSYTGSSKILSAP